jgi:Ca2+-binding RTX toxin-like protein
MLRFRALCLGVMTAACASFLVASPAQATHLDPEGISLGGNRIAFVAGPGETNRVAVSRTNGDYTITDTGVGVGPIPDADGPGGCSVAGQTATCPAAGVTQVFIEVLDGNDEVDGGPGDDTILGGSGGDDIDGHEGNDTVDSGLGDPLDETFDFSVGGEGFNTLTFSLDPERAATAPGPITVDMRENFAADSDGKTENAINFTQLIGTPFDDELVGGHQAEMLIGLGGADTMCGGLGVDTVDYSGSPQGVTVTLDGTQPTDQDLAIQLIPDPGGPGTEELRLRYLRARHDCRETLKPGDPVPPSQLGMPKPGGTRDCTRDDGAPGENDCVGEDVENIIGSPHDDVLVGNDVDPIEGRGPRVEPLGANLIQGGGGNDLMDGRGGPDVYEGGAGHDTVTYGGVPGIGRFGGRGAPVNATIDGAPNDGGAVDVNRANLTDSINTDVEEIVGTLGDDVLRGGAGDETLIGSEGNDFVDGGPGADHLEGNGGNDAVLGGAGNDVVLGGAGDDDVDGEDGDDDVRGEDGTDLVSGGGGADTLGGGNGAGVDTLDYSDRSTPVRVSLDGVNDDGAAGEGDNAVPDFEMVLGGSDDDVLVGGSADEALFGNDGNDELAGGDGADDLSGGPGVDAVTYIARGGPVFVSLAEAGNDGTPGEGDYVLEDVEKVIGGSGDDTLLGDGRVNVLVGGPGNDRIAGAEGDDTLAGEEGNDEIAGDVGNDTLFGGDGNDNLSGGHNNDELKGEAGDDNLDGGPGSDRHNGGPGIDAISYSSRTAAVTAVLDGTTGNGEKGENDFINHDVESVAGGSGGDTLDADDNLRGEVRCGGGTDVVAVDPDDRVNADCEEVQVAARGTRCTVQTRTVNMARSGSIKIRVFCASDARGALRLASVARVRTGKGRSRRVLPIGNRSFNLKAGRTRTVTVRSSRQARRLIRSKKRLSVRARITSKATTQRRSVRTVRVLTVRAPR